MVVWLVSFEEAVKCELTDYQDFQLQLRHLHPIHKNQRVPSEHYPAQAVLSNTHTLASEACTPHAELLAYIDSALSDCGD